MGRDWRGLFLEDKARSIFAAPHTCAWLAKKVFVGFFGAVDGGVSGGKMAASMSAG